MCCLVVHVKGENVFLLPRDLTKGFQWSYLRTFVRCRRSSAPILCGFLRVHMATCVAVKAEIYIWRSWACLGTYQRPKVGQMWCRPTLEQSTQRDLGEKGLQPTISTPLAKWNVLLFEPGTVYTGQVWYVVMHSVPECVQSGHRVIRWCVLL